MRQPEMLPPQAFDKMKVLRDFYDIGEKQHRQGHYYIVRFQKAAEKAIEENHYQKITHIRAYKPVIQVKRNQQFDHKQQHGQQEIRFMEAEHQAWAFEKVSSL
jgi:hypothetical protein